MGEKPKTEVAEEHVGVKEPERLKPKGEEKPKHGADPQYIQYQGMKLRIGGK